MALSKNAIELLKKRYTHTGEQPKDVFKRVANALSLGDEKFEKELYKAMVNGYFLPASPTLRNAGFKKTLLHPCHVLPIDDDISSIFDCIKNTAIVFHYGGGVGFNMSKLRPKGAPLSSGGSSSGVVSFLEIFDKVTDVVKQGGFRRGASISVLDYNHPEAIEFVRSKLQGKLSNFNISVLVNDDFMRKIDTDEKIDLVFGKQVWSTIKAKDLFDLICFAAWNTGDPGLLFFDRIQKDNKLYPKIIIKAVNPCLTGDTYIHTVNDGFVKIEDLYKYQESSVEGYLKIKKIKVYCLDRANQKTFTYIVRVFKTKENAKILKITTSGGVLKCTPDHLINTINRGWVEAKDLTTSDVLYGLSGDSNVVTPRNIFKIEEFGNSDVYDISLFSCHNFFATSIINDGTPTYKGICVHNCGEVPLPEWSCCNLGAINLSKLVTKSGQFNFKKYQELLKLGIKTLKRINAVGWYPFPEMTKMMKILDNCGLGHMGFADCLIKLGIYYDSEDALKFIDEIGKYYVEITNKIAKDSFYKRSQQPTGSLSILADCSSGIEPVFSRAFERHLTVGVLSETRDIYKSKYCKTAMEISPEWHLKVQAKWQEYVDSAVSKTINLPSNSTVDEIKYIYMQAWKMGCKGITVFRDGCKEGVLKASGVKGRIKCDGETCHL